MADLDLDLPWQGEKITASGIYRDVPMAAYHGDLCGEPSISGSGLVKLEKKSPMHFWAGCYLNPKREEEPENDGMLLGRAAHTLLLGQEQYDEKFIVRPEEIEGKPWQGNRTACKEWLKAHRALGFSILSDEQVKTVEGMAASLQRERVLVDMLRGRVERSMVLRDPRTGVWLKSRPDTIPKDGELVDLKTTTDASQRALTRTILDQGYLQKMALAATCFEALTGEQAKGATLLFIETKAPFAYAARPLDNGDLYTGMRLNRRAIDTFARCVRENDWPTHADHFRTWSAPPYWSDWHDKDPSLPDLKGKTL